ncbi:MAG: 4Fe-4S binding protein [Desulfamplus sp.]|nr:4Fe-4S binding protein [Desulfamplus sp.]
MKIKRKIIEINEELCDGCGNCVPSCAEGAIRIIDGKAKVVKDQYCDGLGACLGECPRDALKLVEREAEPFDDEAVKAYLETLEDHHISHGDQGIHEAANKEPDESRILGCQPGESPTPEGSTGESPTPEGSTGESPTPESSTGESPTPGCRTAPSPNLGCGCASSHIQTFAVNEKWKTAQDMVHGEQHGGHQYGGHQYGGHQYGGHQSRLGHWPVQIRLIPPDAPFLKDAHLLITADCAAVAHPNFHQEFLKDRVVMMGCPKFDDVSSYIDKFAAIFQMAGIKTITVLIMEVPCCSGMPAILTKAMEKAGVKIPMERIVIGTRGKEI